MAPRKLPRPETWVDVQMRLRDFSFPEESVVVADVVWFRQLWRGSSDPAPCLECPTRVVYYCQETATECRCFKKYVGGIDALSRFQSWDGS